MVVVDSHALAPRVPGAFAPDDARAIVVIDPDPHGLQDLCTELEAYGCEVQACSPEAYRTSLDSNLFAIVLGPGLPPLRVNALCEQLRHHTDAPIIAFLPGSIDDHYSMILDAGADHCFAAPGRGAARLVLSSVAAARRREERIWDLRSAVIEAGHLRIDLDRRIVTLQGNPVPLTVTEFSILTLLAQRAGQLLSPVEILKRIHGHEYEPAEARDIVKVHVSRLRQKLDADPVASQCIVNVRGQGYRYVFDRRSTDVERRVSRLAVS